MPLSVGSRLGHYDVTALIGSIYGLEVAARIILGRLSPCL